MKSLAVLDSIIEPDWEYRYYSFNSKWDKSEEMGSMRNGQGGAWFCVFSPVGAFLKGFDHESEMSPWSQEPMRVLARCLGRRTGGFQDIRSGTSLFHERHDILHLAQRAREQMAHWDYRIPGRGRPGRLRMDALHS